MPASGAFFVANLQRRPRKQRNCDRHLGAPQWREQRKSSSFACELIAFSIFQAGSGQKPTTFALFAPVHRSTLALHVN
jgi:hypothetical protein